MGGRGELGGGRRAVKGVNKVKERLHNEMTRHLFSNVAGSQSHLSIFLVILDAKDNQINWTLHCINLSLN